MENKKILIVEDELKIAQLLQEYLSAAGFVCECLDDGDLVQPWLSKNWADLIILDLMLPGTDGITLCQQIRAHSAIPIIMASAKVTEGDRLTGLDLGADDYLCKPYSFREMVARVNAVFRRSAIQVPVLDLPVELTVGPFHCEVEKMRIELHSQLLELTVVEFRLLLHFIKNPQVVFSRDELLNNIYDDYRLVADRTIDTHIKNLRQKMSKQIPEKDFIQSVYGAGYKLVV